MQVFNGPKCPNHSVPLTDLDHGIGICPISGARFSYEADENEKKETLKLTAAGYVKSKDWTVTHIDGDDI